MKSLDRLRRSGSSDFITKMSVSVFSQVRLLLKSPTEVEEVKEELKAFRETLTVEPMAFEFKESEGESYTASCFNRHTVVKDHLRKMDWICI